MRLYFSSLVLALVLGLGCGSSNNEHAASDLNADTTSSEKTETTSRGISEAETNDGSQATARRIAPHRNEGEKFTTLINLLEEYDQSASQKVILDYGMAAQNLDEINSEAKLLSLIQGRKDALVALNNSFQQIPSEDIDAHLPTLQQELGKVGIAINRKAGQPTELHAVNTLGDKIEALSTDPFTYYQAFIEAQARMQKAELQFRDMEPVRDMVLAGEKLMVDYPESPHYQMIKTDFRDAVLNFVGVFVLEEGGYTSERLANPMVDSERFVTETETHKQFVVDHPSSLYTPIISRMLEMPSRFSKKPESLYAIYADTASSQEAAREKQFELLNNGKDVLHILPYDAGTQQESYLIAFRFFEDESLSLQCLDETQKGTPEQIQYMMLSVNRNKLYQLGI